MINKQERFCEEYLIDRNATQASPPTGLSGNWPFSIELTPFV